MFKKSLFIKIVNKCQMFICLTILSKLRSFFHMKTYLKLKTYFFRNQILLYFFLTIIKLTEYLI